MSLSLRTRKTIVGLMAGIGVGSGFGASLYGAEALFKPNDTPAEAQEALARAERNAIEAPLELERIEKQIGESCLSALNPYRSGQVLESVVEDTVVNNLIRNPELPCGDNPTEVWIDIVSLKAADEAVSGAPYRVESARGHLNYAKVNEFTGDINDFLLYGGVVGGVTAGVIMNLIYRNAGEDEGGGL